MRALRVEFCPALSTIDPADWNGLCGTGNPFIRHEFLCALEQSGCVSRNTGWEPQHLLIRDQQGQLLGVSPSYLKHHSYGEYVFDWSWADAYHRHGLDYYPKLISAVPFTPSTGPRLMLHPSLRRTAIGPLLENAVETLAETRALSSWHILFPDQISCQHLEGAQLLRRSGCQFHWQNPGYGSFEEFLADLSSRKRKSLRKERRQVAEQGIRFRRLAGREIDEHALRAFFRFYQSTYFKRGQTGYLNLEFFHALAHCMPEQLLLIMAEKAGRYIAGSLFLHGGGRLYGRYWGCSEEYQQLHFECCYYQGIDYCIRARLTTFDAGAQGEHKIQRGFRPVETCSLHWIRHPAFRQAIREFVGAEAAQIQRYRRDAATRLPFKSAPDTKLCAG